MLCKAKKMAIYQSCILSCVVRPISLGIAQEFHRHLNNPIYEDKGCSDFVHQKIQGR